MSVKRHFPWQQNAAHSIALSHEREQAERRAETIRRLEARAASGVILDPYCLLFGDPDHVCSDEHGQPLRPPTPCNVSARMELRAEEIRRARLSDEQRRAEDAAEEGDRQERGREWVRERQAALDESGPRYTYEGWPT